HLFGLAGQQPCNVLLDFTDVTGVASSALALAVRLHKKLQAEGGRLRLCNLSPQVYEAFDMTRLTTLLDIEKAPTRPAGGSTGALLPGASAGGGPRLPASPRRVGAGRPRRVRRRRPVRPVTDPHLGRGVPPAEQAGQGLQPGAVPLEDGPAARPRADDEGPHREPSEGGEGRASAPPLPTGGPAPGAAP